MTDERNDKTNEPAPDDTEGNGSEPTQEAAPADTPSTTVRSTAPPTPEPVRRLVRRPEGKVISGVCTGFAAYFGVDPVMVRVAVVLLVLFSGFFPGVIAYIIAAFVMPMAPEGEPVAPAPRRGDSNLNLWIGIGAIVIGAAVLFHNVWNFRGGIFWGILLVGVGIALWGRELTPRSDRPNHPNPPVTPSGPGSPSGSPTTPLPPIPPAPPLPPRSAGAASSVPAPSPARKEPSMLGRAVVGAAALAIGIALLLDNTGTLDVTPKGVVAVLLLIVGAGLVIGTWFGRARWLIIPGIILSLILGLLAILPDWEFGDGAGERLWQPKTLNAVASEYRLGAGELMLDLSDVDFEGRTKHVEVRVGMGQAIVVVPDHINVNVSARSGAGEIDLFHRQQGGVGLRESHLFVGRSREGQLDLEVRVGLGEITLRRIGDVGDKGTAKLFNARRRQFDFGFENDPGDDAFAGASR